MTNPADGPAKEKCVATSKTTGNRCGRWPMKGATVCKHHGGKAPRTLAKAKRILALGAAQADLDRLGRPIEVDPSEAMLAMVHEAAGNVAFLRGRVQELVQDVGSGGIAGLTGGMAKPNEAVRHVLVVMYDEERERLVKWSKACRDSGIEEQRVALAERYGEEIAGVLRVILEAALVALLTAGASSEVVRRVWAEQVPQIVRGALGQASGEAS